jgi:UDP-glucose 4-epimerase
MVEEEKTELKKIICTGGLGYIGSHTVISLIEKGYEPIILDNISNSSLKCLERLEKLSKTKIDFHKVDLCDTTSLSTTFTEMLSKHTSIHGVIHFASLKAVSISLAHALSYYETNILSTINLLKQMCIHKIPNLIFSSSACVYGENAFADESAPLCPTNPYGETKVIIESLLKSHSRSELSSPFKAISLRYFNPLGAHPSGLIGESPLDIPNNLMPILQNVAVGKQEVLSIYGDDYETKDGTAVRDYIHVCDLAKAHVNALEVLIRNEGSSGFEVLNLGTGQGTSVKELVDAFQKVSGVEIRSKVVGRRPGDVEKLTAKVQKAEELLGWKAEKGIEDMCRDSWNWAKNNPNGYDDVE